MNDVKKELYGRLVQARADVDQKRQEVMIVVGNVYVNPRRAVGGMMSYSKDKGDSGLVAKLEKDPAYFGTMKGHLGSGNSLSLQGKNERGLSKEQVQHLPGLIKETLEADTKLLALERSMGDSGLGSGLEKGKGGLDFG